MIAPQPEKAKIPDEMTSDPTMQESSAKAGFDSLIQLTSDDETARKQYREDIDWIQETSPIRQCGEHFKLRARDSAMLGNIVNESDERELRAAICSQLYKRLSVSHPSSRSVKITTLRDLVPPCIRRSLHKVPMLLRFIHFTLGYFH
jgi:hypothetical protein